MEAPQQNVLDLIKFFRRQWSLVCECERTTVCGADNMLLMLQLAVAEVNKECGNGYTASLSELLLMWKHLLKDKLGLLNNSSQSPPSYDSVRRTYDQLLKKSNSLDLIDLYAAFSKSDSLAETISSVQLQEFLLGHQSEDTDHSSLSISTPCKNNMDFIKMKEVVKRIFCSYLSLLVNSKNDLALAHVINCPERGLDKEAFTDLKHASKNKQMSLFLVATSFIRAVELGGKGYAPSEADPLRKHIKGLSQFVHFIDRLDEMLGETKNAGELILSAIKVHLIKGRGSGDTFGEVVIEVAEELQLRIKTLTTSSTVKESSTGISPARPKIHAINRGTALCGRETIKTFLILLDEEAACPPSKNRAELLCSDEENATFGALPLLSLFRSPEQRNGSSPKPLNQRVQKCMDKNKPKLKQNLIRSQFSCTYKDDTTTHIKLRAFPSMSQVPTCIFPAPKIVPVLSFDDDDDDDDDPIGGLTKEKAALQLHSGNQNLKVGKVKFTKDPIRKSTKRKQLDQCENQSIPDNEPPQKKTLPSTKTKEKATIAKKTSKCAANKQIVGQAKLTSFFRV